MHNDTKPRTASATQASRTKGVKKGILRAIKRAQSNLIRICKQIIQYRCKADPTHREEPLHEEFLLDPASVLGSVQLQVRIVVVEVLVVDADGRVATIVLVFV